MSLIFRSPVAVASSSAWPILGVWLLLSIAAWWLLRGAGPHVELVVDLQSPQADVAQLFYDTGQGYSESESITKAVHAGLNRIEFLLPSGPIFRLRLDPVNSGVGASVSHIAIRSGASASQNALPLDAWKPVAATAISRQRGTISLDSGVTQDPQLQFIPAEPFARTTTIIDDLTRCLFAVLIALAATILLRKWHAANWRIARNLIPMAMAAAAGLILAMALTSTTDRSVHPDEFSHLGAYRYYADHLLPPAADDPATIPSTSVWGFSYLFEWDVVYDIAAHLTAPLATSMQSDLRAARLFQVAMWLMLCALALSRRHWAWTLSVVLLSPQIWYEFAYFNADAFALFLSLIVAGLIAERDNGLHRFLISGEGRGPVPWLAALCIGLLLVSKRNYLPLVPAFLLWVAVLHLGLRKRVIGAILAGLLMLGVATFLSAVPVLAIWCPVLAATGLLLIAVAAGFVFWESWKDIQKRKILMRLTGFVMICAAVAAPRVAWDVHVNGWPAHKRAVIGAIAEARAGPDFKPSMIAAGKGEATIALAARGVPLKEVIFAPYHWAYHSLASAFGVYGYMNVLAPIGLYICLSLLTLLIFSIGLVELRRVYPQQWLALTTIIVGCSVLILASSLLLSWVDQLQAQGRYLLPAFALLALMLGSISGRSSSRCAGAIILVAAALSFGSFAFIALPALGVP